MNPTFIRRYINPTKTTAVLRRIHHTPRPIQFARGYITKIDTYTDTDQINPIEFHNYLKSKEEYEAKEFMEEEEDTLAKESFGADASLCKDTPTAVEATASGREVNGEFARQIHDLLSPTYGE
ncbi:hypothetical protein LPJ66_006685 [Kickxella alabastrina]|uniref:Uncharacterized protein n=1 Tax=Kickxella alabastrina TaxID=61397 RepID=A0ACC1IAY9_9FUNG|nr:hypothetical protein LPJ66_006685 [Kickxella alabastrina]